MSFQKDILVVVLGTAFALGTSGCQLMHEMQPHRLWKWNHGTGGMSPDDYSYLPADRADTVRFMASVADDELADAAPTDVER